LRQKEYFVQFKALWAIDLTKHYRFPFKLSEHLDVIGTLIIKIIQMKKVMMILLLAFGATLYAQPPGHKKDGPLKEMRQKMQEFTPQQRAELKTKRMVLDLDLSPTQQSEILQLNLGLETKREKRKAEKKKKGELAANEIFERTSKMLDAKIATKKQLKSILTEAQFEKFEKSHDKKKRKRKHGYGRKKR
jgi:protein CpxP